MIQVFPPNHWCICYAVCMATPGVPTSCGLSSSAAGLRSLATGQAPRCEADGTPWPTFVLNNSTATIPHNVSCKCTASITLRRQLWVI
jgi:hypothetical protein